MCEPKPKKQKLDVSLPPLPPLQECVLTHLKVLSLAQLVDQYVFQIKSGGPESSFDFALVVDTTPHPLDEKLQLRIMEEWICPSLDLIPRCFDYSHAKTGSEFEMVKGVIQLYKSTRWRIIPMRQDGTVDGSFSKVNPDEAVTEDQKQYNQLLICLRLSRADFVRGYNPTGVQLILPDDSQLRTQELVNALERVRPLKEVRVCGVSAITDDIMQRLWADVISESSVHGGNFTEPGKGYRVHPMWGSNHTPGGPWFCVRETSCIFGWGRDYYRRVGDHAREQYG